LKSAARQFGTTLDDALKVRSRDISAQVDYAVLDDTGALLMNVDWFPLRVDKESITILAESRGVIQKNGRSYLIVSKRIVGSDGRQAGIIILPREITGEQRVIRQHILFNAIATLAAWISALVVIVAYLAAASTCGFAGRSAADGGIPKRRIQGRPLGGPFATGDCRVCQHQQRNHLSRRE